MYFSLCVLCALCGYNNSCFLCGSIFYPYQAKSLRRSEAAGCGSVFGFEYFIDLLGLPSAYTDFDKSTNDISDHIIQETVAFDINVYPLVLVCDITAENCPDGTFPPVGGGGKGFEILCRIHHIAKHHLQQNVFY